jgi:beta-lactamase regulating signal transducer with metallopeptidase domain/biopolymer transport protein ExbD
METYLFKFSACLAIFWFIYILFLERQNMHRFKRFYLLGAVTMALLIPVLTITHYIEPITSDSKMSQEYMPIEAPLAEISKVQGPLMNLETVLWVIYGLGVLLFFTRFIINLTKMHQCITKNETATERSFIYVLLQECRMPHSFFKYIFFNKSAYQTNAVPNEVILHEETHAKQFHSLDIIVIELLQIVFWFHPLIYILKHHIKLNHEFLADQAVLKEGIDTKTYQTILLQFSSNTEDYQLSSAINYSSIKKRFTVMKTQTSKTRIWLSTLLVLPIIAILFYSFSTKEYVEKEPLETSEISQGDTTEQITNDVVYSGHENQENATPKQLAAYKTWVKQLNTSAHKIIKKKDLDTYKYIYSIMTVAQKKTVEPFPTLPPPPPAPKKTKDQNNKVIKQVEINIRKDNSLVLNGKPIEFSALESSVSKINEHLTIAERRKYVSVSIIVASNESISYTQKIQEELRKADILAVGIGYAENQKKQGLPAKHFSLNAGLTVEEAEKQKTQFEGEFKAGKDLERLKNNLNKTAEDKNPLKKSPWSVTVSSNFVEDKDIENYKSGPIEINEATYYFSQQNGETTYFDHYGKVVDITKIPPPPPIPNDASPEQKSKMKKASEAYMKANPDKVGKAEGENGEVFDVIEVPNDLQGSVDINGETFYYTTSNGKTTYYNRYGKEVKMDHLPPPPPATNPSFLEYIIEMEQNGAIFFMDGKKITANEAKAITKNNKGKSTDMITQKDENGKYIVKLSKHIKD